MSMTKTEFFDALRIVQAEEFAGVTEYAEYTFSDGFEKRMERLIRKERSKAWHLVNTGKKRAVLIAAVIILMALTACSIPSVRNAVKGFFLEQYRDHFEAVIVDDSVSKLDYVYSFKPLPEGFVLEDGIKEFTGIQRKYSDAEGREWYLIQDSGASMGNITFYKEFGSISEMEIDENTVYFYKTENFTYSIWMQNGYLLQLYCYDDVDLDTMAELIRSIE